MKYILIKYEIQHTKHLGEYYACLIDTLKEMSKNSIFNDSIIGLIQNWTEGLTDVTLLFPSMLKSSCSEVIKPLCPLE